MRAIRVHGAGGADVLQLEEIDVPAPATGEVLIRVEAVGVNFIEIYQRSGLYDVKMPFVPGGEASGTVTAVGDGVTSIAIGDRVATLSARGSYAEFTVARADQVVRVPDAIDMRDAAALMLQGMTAHYLATSTYPLAPGEWCLIHAAAGGVGLLLTAIAKMRGARVIGTVSTDAKAELARAAGADEIVLYTSQDFESESRRITGGEGVSVVYDSVGKTTFEKSLGSLRPLGMLVLFGQSSGVVPPIEPLTLMRRGSLFLTRPTLLSYVATRAELERRAGDVFAWVAEEKLRPRIDRTYPLAQAADAHRALESRATMGKVLLAP